MTIATLEAEDTAMLATIQPNIRRAGEGLSLARPLSYRDAHEIAGDFFCRDDYFRRSLSPV